MLLKPLITESSLKRAADRNYTFVVSLADTKTQIKNFVEKTFGVKVLTVKTINMPGKEYRSGRRGTKKLSPERKKAIVQIQKDQKIDLFDTPEAK